MDRQTELRWLRCAIAVPAVARKNQMRVGNFIYAQQTMHVEISRRKLQADAQKVAAKF